MQDIKQFCLDSLQDYETNAMQSKTSKPRITQSWLNLSRKGQWHHQHSHPNSLWSGVFYVEAEESDRIVFHRSLLPGGSFQLETQEFNTANSTTWWIQSRPNTLLIFPSTLQHSVPPTKAEQRISLSFNTFPTATIGQPESLTELLLGND